MSLVHTHKNRGDKSDYLAAIKENSSYINTHITVTMCLQTLSADIKIVDSIQYKTFQKRGGSKMWSLVYVPDPVAAILLDSITEEEW